MLNIFNKINQHWLSKTLFVFLLLWFLPGCVNRMFYYPNSVQYRTLESMPGNGRELYFQSGDGTRLHGWFVSSPATNIHGTVVHFHGNAQNLTAHSSFVDWLPGMGYHLFLFDYRGYGKSDGKPSREGLHLDGVAALQEVRRQPEVDTNRIVIIGQSLGGATALGVVGEHPELRGQALIIDSAFSSYRLIVRDKIEAIPLLSLLRVPLSYLLISDQYAPDDYISGIAPVPVLFMHGTSDLVIPDHHSQWMYDQAGEPKKILMIPGGSHICGFSDEYRNETIPIVLDFLQSSPSP